MKKIIAILLALAVVSAAAFAQTVSLKNTVSTNPTIFIDGGHANWQFDPALKEKVEGSATTADARAGFTAVAGVTLNWMDNANANLLAPTPRWQVTKTDISAGGWFKPFDFLKVFVGNEVIPGIPGVQNYEMIWLQGGDYGRWWGKHIVIRGLAGGWETTGMASGLVVGYTGIDKLGIYGGLILDSEKDANGKVQGNDKTTWLKKGAFGGFQLGVTFGGGKYSGDLISVGATWKGIFGGYNPNAATSVVKTAGDVGDTDKKYQNHTLWVGATFTGLSDLKVGITLNGTVGFNYEKASEVMGTKKNTSFLVSLSPTFNFRNGISDQVIVTVGYNNYDGKKAKVLPFMVSNSLTYSLSSDASFNLYTAYERGALSAKKKTYTDPVIGDVDKINDKDYSALNGGSADNAAVIAIKPSFSFNLGKHGFSVAVATNVMNDLQYHKKTAQDWAFWNIKGLYAKVAVPISWTYTF